MIDKQLIVIGALALITSTVCVGQSLSISTEPGCKAYALNEKHLPNVPACKPQKEVVQQNTGWWSTSTGTTTTGYTITRYAEVTEIVTKDGHYKWTLDDPNNEYRCQITSVQEDENVTVVCMKPHGVPIELSK